MAILDFFKKPKPAREGKPETPSGVPKREKPLRAETQKPKAAAGIKKKETVKTKAEKTKTAATLKPEEIGRERQARFAAAYRILKSPAITEKATDLASQNQYVFKVSDRSNKTEIKKAIESVYGVNVLAARIINVPNKARKIGRQRGWKAGYKKAIVKIKKGQKIEVLPR